jgi:cellulose synthase operon protein YhjQ
MPIIALSGIHGGTGTTSVVSALAWALYRSGESVLVIDFSPDNLLRMHFNMPHDHVRGWAKSEIDGEGWQQGAMEYCERLAFLPFGQTTREERAVLFARLLSSPGHWRHRLSQLRQSQRYRWILLDIPAEDNLLTRQLLLSAEHILMIINPDANCHVRLHQQPLPGGTHLVVNNYVLTSSLQHDIYQLWSQTLAGLVPVMIHHDEAVAESLAAKQPVGEYRPDSTSAEEITTLANWCLIHCSEAVS